MLIDKLSEDQIKIYQEFENSENNITLEQFIKNVIRYESDHYVVVDPSKDDPIDVSDEVLDSEMKFFIDTYNEVIHLPYLDMNSYLNKIKITRKSLKYNDLMLYARKELAKVDLGMTDDDNDSFFDINFDRGDILDFNKISKDQETNDRDIQKIDGARLLVEYLTKMVYGGILMNQIELIVEKLNWDVRKLDEGTDLNKNKNIKDIINALSVIKTLGKVEENEKYMDTKWYSYFIETIVYDARAIKLVKEISSNPKKAKSFIEKIFGPNMISAFEKKYSDTVNYDVAPTDIFIKSSVILMLYTMAKKIKSYMKSKNCRSLIYRGYIIHYMLDELDESELAAMNNLFKYLFDLYLSNEKLTNILRKNSFYEILMSE